MADNNNIQITLTANSDQVQDAARKVETSLQGLGTKAKEAMSSSAQATARLETAMSSLAGVITRVATAYTAWRAAEYIKDSALLAARYETLGVTMNVVGRTAGYTSQQMQGFSTAMQAQGITMLESRASLARLAQAHVDLAQASKLARIAQDAAVIGNMNSSQAFEHLVYGIQTANVRVLRTIGLNTNFEESYKRLANQLGVTTLQLTEQEKSQARVNAVEEAGARITGAYEAAMGTAGKQLTSLSRYFEDFKVKLGEAFGPAVKTIVSELTEKIKQLQAEVVKPGAQETLQGYAKAFADWANSVVDLVAKAPELFRFLDKWGGELVTLAALIWGAQKAQLAFNAAVSMNPFVLAGTAVVAAGSYIAEVKKHSEGNWQTGKFDPSIPITSDSVSPGSGYAAGAGIGYGTIETLDNEQILELHRQKALAFHDQAQDAQQPQYDARSATRKSGATRAKSSVSLDMHPLTMTDLHAYNSLVAGLENEAARDQRDKERQDVQAAKAAAQEEAQATKDKVAQQMAYLDEWFKDSKTKAQKWSAVWQSAYTNMQSFVGNTFYQLMQGNYKNIGASFSAMVERMVAEWAAAQATMALLGNSNTGQLGGLAGSIANVVGAWLPSPAITQGTYGVLQSDAMSGATTPLWSTSLPGVQGSYAVGTDYVPYDMVAKIHKGEAIIPADKNRGAAPVTVNVVNSVPNATASAQTRNAADGSMTIDVMVEQIDSALSQRVARGQGRLARTMEGTYGLNRAAGAYS